MQSNGLGSDGTLARIDRIRELNVGSIIPLPQLVVVGDQSSGKSSVLESTTGFSFPRAPGLCTRHVTQITCCRDGIKSVYISIIPRPDADEELKSRLLAFHRRFIELDNDELAKVFEDANRAMGIRMAADFSDANSCAFSQDILRIEIRGPEEVHLTVIDVPGIFRVPTPGLTTETDITLVENMVKSYMANSRTIILAVIPCNVDVTTQEILKLAEIADPDGTRTMGVLTKPDLATEAATRDAVMELVTGKRGNLKLGYYVVKNRGADDNTSSLTRRAESEKAFFMAPFWARAKDRCGVAALKERLRQLLSKISNQELPHVKVEVAQRLHLCKAQLETIGPARTDQVTQRLYLGKLATRFQTLTQAALNGHYGGEPIFDKHPDLKLITRVLKLCTIFADTFWSRGHKHYFHANWDDEGEKWFGEKNTETPLETPLSLYAELNNVIETEDYKCPKPSSGTLFNRILDVYESNRGPELGTYSGAMLSAIFVQQSEKWTPLALSHVSKVVAVVHDFVFRLLNIICPEALVRDQLWNELLVDRLVEIYRKAMAHTQFLLNMERSIIPCTFNHYYNTTLQQKRAERLAEPLMEKGIQVKGYEGTYVRVREIEKCVVNKSNEQQACEDIMDSLVSYYKVSRKRFVDVVCQQVIFHLLLSAEDSPLRAFDPELVMKLNSEQLETIAGGDEECRRTRQCLEREVQSLEAALKVLRT